MESIKLGEGVADISIKLNGDDGNFYINRGLEKGIDLKALSSQLTNKEATLYYIKHWSLLNFDGKTRHIARIELGDKILYNEWGEN